MVVYFPAEDGVKSGLPRGVSLQVCKQGQATDHTGDRSHQVARHLSALMLPPINGSRIPRAGLCFRSLYGSACVWITRACIRLS